MSLVALVCLVIAVLAEVAATMSLRMAASGHKMWWVSVGGGYLLAFTMLTIVLAEGVALGVAYGTWAASGVALTAVLSRVFFKEPLTIVMVTGLAMIIGGVLMIELGSGH